MFTLHDLALVLVDEHFRTLDAAVERAYEEPWTSARWRIHDPTGRPWHGGPPRKRA